MHGLTTIFLVHELGIKDQQIASSMIQSYLWCLVKDEFYQSKSSTLDELEQQILYTLPLEILRKSIESISQFAEVCARCLGLCFKIGHEPQTYSIPFRSYILLILHIHFLITLILCSPMELLL
jgi:hypothetical protein